MKILKQAIGIDISKDKFDCCYGALSSDHLFSPLAHQVFSNNTSGFNSLCSWINQISCSETPVLIAMEATGVYYENLAYYLYDKTEYKIHVTLPAQVKYFFKSLSHKTKTDKIDAQMITQFVLERKIRDWQPISCKLKIIKSLSREYRDNKKMINQLKNQRHAKLHSYKPSPYLMKRLNQKITLVENQCLEVELEIKNLVFENAHLTNKIEQLTSIPGVGFMTAVTVIAETNGFALIRNAKQLASYAGLDVQQNNSGNKIGKSKLSKKGNTYIRQALYMPAMSASRANKQLKKFYQRINAKNACKKVGVLAVSRKLLLLMYTLWKNDQHYQLMPN